MNYLDIVFLIIAAAAFILGFKDGFVRKLIGSLGFFLAIFLGIFLSETIGSILNKLFGTEKYLAEIFGGFMVFLAVILTTSLLKRVIHPFDKVNNFMNRITGGVVGIIQIIYFLSAALYLLHIFKVPSEKDQKKSFSYSTVYRLLPKTIDYIGEFTPNPKKSIKELIIEKDSIKE
ncbi:MAG: CvpA family protein [Ignavibacteriaceae bacterium]|nr:CvpA family protein [Ignavibacteriaceae bacterium]